MTHTIRRKPPRPVRCVRMTDAEWSAVVAVAVRRQVHVSSALRELALEAAERELAEASR